MTLVILNAASIFVFGFLALWNAAHRDWVSTALFVLGVLISTASAILSYQLMQGN